MRTASVGILAVILVQTLSAQDPSPANQLSALRFRPPQVAQTERFSVIPAPGDLVVGFPNPNEVREISAQLLVEGNVLVLNNGRLRVTGAPLRIQGDLHVLNNGGVEVQSGRLEFVQSFLYQRIITISNTASLWLSNSTLDLGGYNLSCAVTDTATLRLDASAVSSGVMTTSVQKEGRVDASDSQPLGEILFFDSSTGSFSNCALLLTWLVLPDGSTMRGSFPGSQVLDNWVFPDSLQSSAGFSVRVNYANCLNLAWALMLLDGCDAVIEDSDLLAVGAIFRAPGSSTVSGLVNGTTQGSYQFPATDRSARFDRTRVGAWNLYSMGQHELTVNNCVFGEILAFENSSATVTNSICDGSGGYIGSMDDARLQLVQSSLRAPVIARQRSRLYTIQCTLQNSVAYASESSVLALLHSTFTALPTVDAGAVAAVLGIDDPSQAAVNARVPVYGTVRFIPGKDVPVSFVSYWLDGIRLEDPDDPFPVSAPSIKQPYRDTLCVWNTDGLLPGDHALRIYMRLSSGDTLMIPWTVRLTPSTAIRALPSVSSLHIGGIAPNPALADGAVTLLVASQSNAEAIRISVYDMLGRRMHERAIDAAGVVSIGTSGWPRGYYRITVTQGAERAASGFVIR